MSESGSASRYWRGFLLGYLAIGLAPF